MNINNGSSRLVKNLVATAVAAVLLAACATAPLKPDGAAQARNKLTQLQADPNLATRAPQAIEAADAAVRLAEQPEADKDLGAYRVYMADRKVEIARADAQTRYAEDQRVLISAQRDQARLDARTREADAAKGQVAIARAEGAEQRAAAAEARAQGAEQKVAADQARAEGVEQRVAADQARAEGAQQKAAADQARTDADLAKQATADSNQRVAELKLQVEALQARPTDRGLVLTLGDALFSTGRADLQPGAGGHLQKLVTFLNKYPDRTVVVEGYTDSVGSEDYNQGLSERRAGAVRTYLIEQGISSIRLSALGKGASNPVAGNDTASGRQQNRRVEVVISDPVAASR
jgi:outer membrane protein OmpA-like peptidoglycan-associated protein